MTWIRSRRSRSRTAVLWAIAVPAVLQVHLVQFLSAPKSQTVPTQLVSLKVRHPRPPDPTWQPYYDEIHRRNKTLPDDITQRMAELVDEFAEFIPPWYTIELWDLESKFNVDAVGRYGERGLGQLLPSTAKAWKGRAPQDNWEATRWGLEYLAKLKWSWSHSKTWKEALGRYHRGPNWRSKRGQWYAQHVMRCGERLRVKWGIPKPVETDRALSYD